MTDLQKQIELEALITEREALNAEIISMQAHDQSNQANDTGPYNESSYLVIVKSLTSIAENIRALNKPIKTAADALNKFKPGQLVIANIGSGLDFLALFKCIKIHESFLVYEVSNLFGDKGAMHAVGVRHPTEAERLEFREGKK